MDTTTLWWHIFLLNKLLQLTIEEIIYILYHVWLQMLCFTYMEYNVVIKIIYDIMINEVWIFSSLIYYKSSFFFFLFLIGRKLALKQKHRQDGLLNINFMCTYGYWKRLFWCNMVFLPSVRNPLVNPILVRRKIDMYQP